MKILTGLPVPIFGAAFLEFPPGVEEPSWIMAALVGAYVVLWLLDKIGVLPGTSKERREASFTPLDRAHLDRVFEVISREDPDKPGWPMVWSPSRERREAREHLRTLAELAADNAELAKELKNLTSLNVEVLRTMERSLNDMHQRQADLSDKLDHIIGSRRA